MHRPLARLPFLALAALATTLGGCITDDLSGTKCDDVRTCGDGYECDHITNTCRKSGNGISDAGAPDGGGGDAGNPDAGPPDAGPPDAATDAGPNDGGPEDAGTTDSGSDDAGPPDSGPGDAGPADAGPPDAGAPDAGPPDAGLVGTACGGPSECDPMLGIVCCSSICVQSDVDHCGTACTPCTAPANAAATCAAGTCTLACNPGFFRRDTTNGGVTTTECLPVAPGDPALPSVAAGASHTCAILYRRILDTSFGVGVKCWGANDLGQLGRGDTVPATGAVDVDFGGLGLRYTLQIRAIAAGFNHTCAVLLPISGGAPPVVACWGDNQRGQLGLGSIGSSSEPSVNKPSGVSLASGDEFDSLVTISAGGDHTCMIVYAQAYRLMCWGSNTYGESAFTSPGSPQPRPANVAAFWNSETPITIAAGGQHTCAGAAVGSPGDVSCWGYNHSGQAGWGFGVDLLHPPTFSDAFLRGAAIVAGENHTCLLGSTTDSIGLSCFGDNSMAQASPVVSAIGTPVTTPTPVSEFETRQVFSAALGNAHSCAITYENGQPVGQVRCWGDNRFGQAGCGTQAAGCQPLNGSIAAVGVSAASGLPAASLVVAGSNHTCALVVTNPTTGASELYCWGSNASGQTWPGGDPSTNVPTPTLVTVP